MKILLTSGGTKIPIDRVRSISNMSRGTFGAAICKAFLEAGHEVDFLMAKDSRTPFELKIDAQDESPIALFEDWGYFVHRNKKRCNRYTYKTFDDYADSINKLMTENKYDIVVLAAAVFDYGVANYVDKKIRTKDSLTLQMKSLPKIISSVKALQPETFLVGFKLLVDSGDDELIEAAKNSIVSNKCNIVVANDLRDIQQGKHRLLLVTTDDVQIRETQPGKHLSVQLVEDILAKLI